MTLKANGGAKTGFVMATARTSDEDRPWSPKPKTLWRWDNRDGEERAE